MSIFKLTGLKGCLPLICTSLRMFEQCGSFLSFSGILTDVEQPYCQQWSKERWDRQVYSHVGCRLLHGCHSQRFLYFPDFSQADLFPWQMYNFPDQLN